MLRWLQRLVASERWMRVLGVLLGSLNPWHPDVRRDPYPSFRRLRERPGLPRLRLFGGSVAARYAEVERVLREPAFSTDRGAVPLLAALRRAGRDAPEFLGFLDHNLLMIDGARHRRLRGLVGKAFTPRRVERVVIAELLGVPAALHERFAAWSDDLVQLLDPLSGHDGLEPPKRAHCAVGELHGRLEAQALLRRGPAEEQPGSRSA